jgi:peptidoglycan LD-endopeptidase CwlK
VSYVLSKRSLSRLEGVHPDLVRVVKRAIQLTAVDFMVTEGTRTKEKQEQLIRAGASLTMHSRHLPTANQCRLACAVDLAAMVDGEVRWDWPLYPALNEAMQKAGKELGVPIEWGGGWRTLKDGPHFQLPWKEYP